MTDAKYCLLVQLHGLASLRALLVQTSEYGIVILVCISPGEYLFRGLSLWRFLYSVPNPKIPCFFSCQACFKDQRLLSRDTHTDSAPGHLLLTYYVSSMKVNNVSFP